MRLTAVFCFNCVCGRYIESESRVGQCPHCHREFVLDWGKPDTVDPPPEARRAAKR